MRILAVTAIVIVAYWFMLRPVLRERAEMAGFYQRADLIEAGLFTKLRVAVKGFKTIIWARFLFLAGPILAALQMLDVVDLSTILPPIPIKGSEIPASVYVPLILTPAVGWITEKLRRATDGPVGENTFVVAPDAAPLTPAE